MRAFLGLSGGLVAFVAAAVLAAAAAGGSAASPQPVMFIGDSASTSILDHASSTAIVSQGVTMDFQLAPCRRLVGTSCWHNGKQPPTVVDLLKTLGSAVAPNVVIAVGYNDYEDQYAAGIASVLGELERAGVRHVLWLNLHAVRHPYLSMNDDILAAAATHPEVTVVDWNGDAQGHPGWFQDDGIHLQGPGPDAMATAIHDALVSLGIAPAPPSPTTPAAAPPPPVRIATRSLPAARKGERYRARLQAAAGTQPYSWSFPHRPPRGLHVRPDGTIFGKPTGKPGTFRLVARVTDAKGGRATASLRIQVRR